MTAEQEIELAKLELQRLKMLNDLRQPIIIGRHSAKSEDVEGFFNDMSATGLKSCIVPDNTSMKVFIPKDELIEVDMNAES